MKLSDFNYELPEELIAQHPAEKRENSRLLVIDRKNDHIEHKNFYDIISYLKSGDLLVLNDSKVIPARLFGVKESTGAKIEFLLIKRIQNDQWEAMVRPGKKLKIGDVVSFSTQKKFQATVLGFGEEGTRIVEFSYDENFHDLLDEYGKIPLPPYIDRENEEEDKDRYQTVYAKNEGSVAAPTAGLHFTQALLREAQEKGVETAYVTLHVGIGTFRPVKCENVLEHTMHYEEYHVSEDVAEKINKAKAEGRRVICVGTTSSRTIESAAFEKGKLKAGSASTNLFIYPGYEFKIVDALITNFHLPKSTLLMLISALWSREKMLEAYGVAVKEEYHFFSYGDAMFIY